MIQGTKSVTIIRQGSSTVDAYGNATFTTSEVVIDGVLVAYNSSSEPVDINRDPVSTMLTLYLPFGTEIFDGDIFEVAGEQWVKNGDPATWPIVNGLVPGVTIGLRRHLG
jgi:hypothetical protein